MNVSFSEAIAQIGGRHSIYYRILYITATIVLVSILAGCSTDVTGPKPSLKAPSKDSKQPPAYPGIVCRDQLVTEVLVNGDDFSPIPIDIPDRPRAALPLISLTRSHQLDGSKVSKPDEITYGGDPDQDPNNISDQSGEGTELISWKDAQKMAFIIDQDLTLSDKEKGMLQEGVYDMMVTNPNGEKAESIGAFAVIDKPYLTGISPSIVCLADQDRRITLTGSRFLENGENAALLQIEGSDVSMELSECTAIAHKGLDAELCDSAEVVLKQNLIDPGYPALTIQNPETAACHSEEEINLRVVAAPEIDSLVNAVVCIDTPQHSLGIEGSGFITIDGNLPTVLIGGDQFDIEMDNCEDLTTMDNEVQICSSMTVDVMVGELGVGSHTVEVQNPDPAACSGTAAQTFRIVTPPTITSIVPDNVCGDQTTTFTITGTDFIDGASVTIGETVADSVTVVSETELEARFEAGVSIGTHDVVVSNGGQCSGTLQDAVSVDPPPLVFFVDPPIIYNGVSIDSTIYTSGLSEQAKDIQLVDSSEEATELTFSSDASKPNRIQATLPAGLTADTYEIQVTDHRGCIGQLAGGLSVTDQLTIAVDSIKPDYVSPNNSTAVTISAQDPAPSGEVQFESTPRVYLNPNPAGSGTVATALRATVFMDTTTMTAVIPGGLNPGSFDLIVVNPSGNVGLIENAVVVTAGEPPVIYTATPASLVTNTSDSIKLAGENFDTAGVTVQLICQTPSGSVENLDGTVSSNDDKNATVDFTVPTSIDQGSVCIVKLVNGDGAYFEYSAISITNSSLNLAEWTDSPDLNRPRRALSLVAGRPTNTSRFLYAIGGDSGEDDDPEAVGTVEKSVEASSVDVFGDMTDWYIQTNELPEARTWAGAAQIGRFIYLVGGNNGTSATNTLFRSQILDPLATPEVTDLDVLLGDGDQGLEGGLWYYRVSATFPDDDPNNPGGESLPGETFTVQLPDRTELLHLTLTWEAIEDANGYRIYRSPSADSNVNNLELLATIDNGTTVTYTDTGMSTTESQTPLVPGSLGQWHAISTLLNSNREAHATVAAPDLNTAEDDWFLYVFGGRDQNGTYLDSYEYAKVTIASDGSQTISTWTEVDGTGSASALSVPRAEIGAWVLTEAQSNAIAADEVWIFIGGGRTTGGGFVGDLEANTVGTGGDLGTLVPTDEPANYAGYGYGAANAQLFIFGGAGGTGSSGGISAQLCEEVAGSCGPLPDLKPGAWNSLGFGAPNGVRVYMGSTQESAFFFLAGGHDGTTTLSSTEQTVQ